MELTQEQIKAVKGRGFLRNRGTNCFSARVLTGNGVMDSQHLETVARLAKTYGAGRVAFTTRLTIEVPGIPYEKLDEFEAAVLEAGLLVGGTGPKVRPVVCCKGTTCVFGRLDTQDLAQELHQRYYVGWHQVTLPHKFKIAVGGCPNNCVKPDLNDFGIVGFRQATPEHEALYNVFLGGRWGRDNRHGTPLSGPVTRQEAVDMVEKALLLFKKLGEPGKRFSDLVDRLGIQEVEKLLRSDQLLEEKEAILKG